MESSHLVVFSTSGKFITKFNVLRFICLSETLFWTGAKGRIPITLIGCFPTTQPSNVEALVNIIQSTSEQDLCSVKTSKRNVVIPKGKCLKIPCRVNHSPVDQLTTVLFEPEETSPWPSGLTFNETLLSVKPGKSNRIHVEAINTTNHDIVLPNRTLIGRLQLVQSVISVEMTLRENESKADQQSSNLTGNTASDQEASDRTTNILPSHLKDINMDALTKGQRDMATTLLISEQDSFAESDSDVGSIPDLQLNIKVRDEIPVQKNYVAVPKPLYPEGNSYIEDLLNQNFIRKSTSPYSSPVVCVRKKDKSLRLCVGYRALNQKTIPDRHPIPRIKEALDSLGGNTWFQC